MLASLLFDMAATDAVTFATIAGVLLGVSILAGIVPARRAARVDPASPIRLERNKGGEVLGSPAGLSVGDEGRAPEKPNRDVFVCAPHSTADDDEIDAETIQRFAQLTERTIPETSHAILFRLRQSRRKWLRSQ